MDAPPPYPLYEDAPLPPQKMGGELTPIVIAVMGVTGVGKSYFVKKASGQEVTVGGDLRSCTSEVKDFVLDMPPYRVHLVDTPGFDDSFKNDVEILKGIAQFLQTVYDQRGNLSGILYLHQITDARMKGSALKNIDMFQNLIGERNLRNCVLVTTKWGEVDPEDGRRREEQLVNDRKLGWKNMISNGATTARFDGSHESAVRILQSIAGLNSILPRLTEELCVDRKQLKDTKAGKVVSVELEELLQEKQAEIEIAKRQAAEALQQKDTEYHSEMEERRVLETEMAKVKEGQAIMEKRVEEMRVSSEKRDQEIRQAEADRRKHDRSRTATRWLSGIAGAALILGTAGAATPFVFAGAGAAEVALQNQKSKDRKRVDALHKGS